MHGRQPLLAAAAVATMALAAQAPAQAPAQLPQPIYVIVNVTNPISALAPRDAIAVFTGRRRSFADGREATPFDQSASSKAREDFYLALTGMDLARINSYWARLRFSGQVQAPAMLEDDKQVVGAVRADPRGVGYVRTTPADPGVKVVLTLSTRGD